MEIKDNSVAEMENIYFDKVGRVKAVRYKTFRGLIKVLKTANEAGLKHKGKMKFTITLPIKR